MGVELDQRYQVEAYDAIQSSIKETGKAGVVLPTGTGKTYLALKLIEDNLDKDQILYVSPSPTINVQVRKKIKEIYPKEEAEKILSKVKFVTYAGLDKRFKHSKFDMQEYNSDVIILDEVHRSGAEDWGKAVDYLLETNSNAQVLGMTATPLRSDGQNMIEKRFGETAYELKLSEAVARGILTLPTYISSRYIFTEDIEDLQSKINLIENKDKREEFQKKLDKARKSVEKSKGLKEILKKHMKDGKWLVFCNPGDNIEELQEQAKKEGWFDDINENQTFLSVESTRTDSENDMALRTFERKGGDDLIILYSKNMLNEGIHDEEITGEIMLRPTKSYILFTQQLGRILSKDRPEEPIVLDLVGNIKYFKEFRLEIQEIIREGIARGDTRYNEKTLEQFKILEEQEDFIQAFEEIEASIEKYMNKTAIEEILEILEKLKAEGIDVNRITRKRNGEFIKLYEIENENIENIIKKIGLNREYPIGYNIASMLAAYRGYSTYAIREEDIERIEQLGFEKEVDSSIEELLDILEKLELEGIDVTKILQRKNGKFIKLYEIESENIEDIIKKLNVNREYPIGQKIRSMLSAYRGKSTCAITKEDIERIERLGFKKEVDSAIEELLDILEKLKLEGIDVTAIQRTTENHSDGKKTRSTYLHEVVSVEIIEKLELDSNYKIGRQISSMLEAYKGRGSSKITEKDVERIQKLGFQLEREKSAITKTLEILEILKNEGIDLNKDIQQTKTERGKTRGSVLYEIDNEKIEEIIIKYNLDREFPIGDKIHYMMRAYKGTSDKTITDEERKKIESLGFDMKSTTERTLDILEMLQEEGIDVSKIQKNKRVNGKMRTTYLYEVVANEIIERLGLDPNEKIGGNLTTIKRGYRRDVQVDITDEQRKKIEDMGLVTELDKKVAEQNLLKKKQAETKKLKSEVQQELDKQTENKDIGDTNE